MGRGARSVKFRPNHFEVVWSDEAKGAINRCRLIGAPPSIATATCTDRAAATIRTPNCAAFELATGKVMWSEPNLTRTTLLYVDGHFVSLGEYGALRLIKVTPERFEPVAEAELVDRSEKIGPAPPQSEKLKPAPLLKYPAWSPPVLSHGLLYVRGKGRLVCVELIPPDKLAPEQLALRRQQLGKCPAAIAKQFAVAHPLDVLAHQFDVVIAVVAGGREHGDDLPQRQRSRPQPLPRLFAARRRFAVAQMHDGDMPGDRESLDQLRIVPQVIRVQGQLQARMGQPGRSEDGLVERGQEGPIAGTGRMYRLDRQDDVELHRQRQQFAQRTDEQSPGVIVRVVVAAAGINDQAAGFQSSRQPNRVGGILHAFGVGMAIAAGEAAGPQQIGNSQATLGQQFHGVIFAQVGHLCRQTPMAGIAAALSSARSSSNDQR